MLCGGVNDSDTVYWKAWKDDRGTQEGLRLLLDQRPFSGPSPMEE